MQIFKVVLEPILTIEDIEKHPQPIRQLYELCQKQGKQAELPYSSDGPKRVACVYVDGNFVASASCDKIETARLSAARLALLELAPSSVIGSGGDSNGVFESQGAKQKLHEVCQKKRWTKPNYKYDFLLSNCF